MSGLNLPDVSTRVKAFSLNFPDFQWGVVRVGKGGHFIVSEKQLDFFAESELVALWQAGVQIA